MLTEPGGALEGALELAEQICSNAPLSVQACLSAVNGLVGRDDGAGWESTQHAYASLESSQDLEEGVRSFLEKRPPVWTGE